MKLASLLLAATGWLAACGNPEAPALAGYVEAEPTRVAAPLAGRLVALAVQRGAEVQAGAPLFTLEHDSEAAALLEAQAQAARAEASARDLDKGQRRDELAAAQAALDAARAALQQSQGDLARQRELARSGFSSGADLQALAAKRDADAARVRQLEAQLRAARLGGRDDTRAAARAAAQAASAAVAQSQWRLAQKAVVAPVAARVEDTLYRVGEWVAAGAPVVSLQEPGALKLRFYAPEAELARLRVGARVAVRCDGCGAPFAATVRFIARQAEFTPPVIYSRENRQRLVFLVEATPPAERAAQLRPGLPIEVRLDDAPGAAASR